MLVSKAHDFGFVHIPKCAGSTITHQLRDYDDFDGTFYRAQEVDGLGYVNGNHMPLSILRRGFPEAYAALCEVHSYAICRHPSERFVSSIAQRLRDLGLTIDALSAADIRRETHVVIDKLVSDEMTNYERYRLLIIFRPQCDFVLLDDQKVIDTVVPMERMDAFLEVIGRRHDLPIKRDTVFNPTVSYRVPAMEGPLRRAQKAAKRLLPLKPYMAVRDVAAKVLTTKGTPKLADTLGKDPQIAEFISAYYRRDFDLYREARENDALETIHA